MENADGFSLTNMWLDFKSGPVLDAKNTKNIRIDQITTAATADLLVRASGTETANVRILNSAVKVKKSIELTPDVKPGTVVVE
jgi:hypothetical protein